MRNTLNTGQTFDNQTMPLKGVMYALGAVMIWTGFILVSKAGALAALAIPDMIMVRFGTAFTLFSPFIWRYRKTIFQWRMGVLGAIGGLAYALSVFNGFAHAPATPLHRQLSVEEATAQDNEPALTPSPRRRVAL